MSAGTLALTNKSDAVKGTGTTFTTMKTGDFIVVSIGGTPYTLTVKSIVSDTQLTLISKFTGPTQSGLAWYEVPREAQSLITAALATQITEALRGQNLDKDNWQQVFSVSDDITVTLKDGSQFTGPSWLKIVDLLKTVDLVQAQKIADQIRQSQNAVAGDKQTVAADRQEVESKASEATASAQAAAESQKAAAMSATEAGKQATTATEQAERAEIAADDAEQRGAAQVTLATDQAERAREEADRAAASNPANALLKAENLADLADKAVARQNLLDGKPLKLGAPALNPDEAPTLLQVQNMSGGATGPTQSGVMNFGIGSKRLHDSRNYIPPYEVVADGQLLNRADWPDLWAYAQMVGVVADADWRGDVAQRAKYSSGDGSLTFRVPDLNGVQLNSIPSLYGRGDGGLGVAGQAQEGGVPNITGSFGQRRINSGTQNTWSRSGAFLVTLPSGSDLQSYSVGGSAAPPEIITFDASLSNRMYKNISEVRPNSFFNVWVIRASGAFLAANTSFGVMNSYASGQPDQSLLEGGRVQSEIRIEGAVVAKAALVVKARVGGTVRGAIDITDSRGSTSVTQTLTLPEGDGVIMKWGDYGIGSAQGVIPSGSPINANNATYNGFYTGNGAGGINFINEYMPLLVLSRNDGGNIGQIQVGGTGTLGSRAKLSGSWTPWRVSWSDGNTTVDSNGFIKRASPVVKIFTNGNFETNEESEGVIVTRQAEGVYLIEGCLGLNSDGGWGGPDGGFEIPVDRNKQPLLWLDYEVNADGSVLVKTYHRVNDSAPSFAQNLIEGKKNGDPVDIPTLVYVSVRLQMPEKVTPINESQISVHV
ncbi:pyocin knob domain-containing protein [Siccibacter turicensis]|uniref:pyocin knob domain-containing protein n=1 Tax=Siccibacter turicensis TaxID=357233 RepID=UPI003F558404